MSQITPTEAATNAVACMLQDDYLKAAIDAYIDTRIMQMIQAFSARYSGNTVTDIGFDRQQEL